MSNKYEVRRATKEITPEGGTHRQKGIESFIKSQHGIRTDDFDKALEQAKDVGDSWIQSPTQPAYKIEK